MFASDQANTLDEQRVEGDVMDLSGIIIVVLGMLLFFGGAAGLEIRSGKNKQPDREGELSPQPAVARISDRRTVQRRRGEE
jgi:hypothetical protein